MNMRRALGWCGGAMMLVGLGLLGYVAWQLWGTGYVSTRTHERLVRQVDEAWKQGEETVQTEEGEVGAVVRIPSFGADYAVPLLEGTSDEALAAGFGRLTSGAEPGGRGNFALAGHRVTHGEPLRRMPELGPGDEVVVETARWRYTYVLDTGGADLVVPFTHTWVIDELPTNPDPGGPQPVQEPGQRLLTLTTCAELFHTDDRMIAFGHLETKEPR